MDDAPRLSNRILDQTLTRFLLRRCLDGVVAGQAAMLGLLWTDVGHVGSLVRSSEHGVLALFMLSFAFAITFGSAAMGIAVNGLGRRGGEDGTASAPQEAVEPKGARTVATPAE